MLLIDAIYINNSGGKILLDFLIESLEKTDFEVCYLLDKRIVDNHPIIKTTNKIIYLKAGLFSRYLFYISNSRTFSKVLCFGNLPPSVKINAEVFTYFHQQLFIEVPQSLRLLDKMKIQSKMVVLNLLKRNTNIWLVQSENMKNGLANKYNLDFSSIKLLPFYSSLKAVEEKNKKKNSFVYVSNGGAHKNHDRLIDAFCNFYDKYRVGELGVTISDIFIDLKEKIEDLNKKGYPIINYGFVNINDLAKVYAMSEFLIYPSLAESFGLGIVEGIETECKVIGADLPYMYAVCEPSLSFNPYSIKEIEESIETAVFSDTKISTQKIENEIEKLIQLLK
jgi:glycosyltransferase involved in cell wall biosynthesis